MDIAEVKAQVAAIERLRYVSHGLGHGPGGIDDEAAHVAEDNLWALVLREIAAGAEHPALLAKEAIKTAELQFSRWYS